MSKTLDVVQRWPELFTDLDQGQHDAVLQALAAGWHEGWEPNQRDVKNLVDKVSGRIDQAEYVVSARQLKLLTSRDSV